jgi:hypothetical protein
MAIAISVAASYQNSVGGTSITSGAFNVAAGDLLIVVGHCDQDPDVAQNLTISDNQAPDLAWTQIAARDGLESATGGLAGGVAAWRHAATGAITGLTVTLTVSGLNDSPSIKVFKVTGFDTTTPVGTPVEGDWTASGQQTSNITPGTNGIGIMAATNWNVTACTSVDTTETAYNDTGNIAAMSGYQSLTSGVAANADMTASGPIGPYLWFEVREAAGGGGGRTALNTRSSPLGVNVGMGWRMGGAA